MNITGQEKSSARQEATDRDKRDVLVFAGHCAQTPSDIRRALGWLHFGEQTDDDLPHPLEKFVGAVQSLCHTVEKLQLELDELKLAQLKGQP